ncbi:MAG: hypothetical protein ACKOYJ_09785 [Planctomycetia bacterium]
MNAVPRGPSEVWLRGNLRVAAVLTCAGLFLDGLAVAPLLVAILGSGNATPWWIVAAVVCGASTTMLLLAWAASRPRLVREGSTLVVQVSPLVRETVPLEIVECFFPGSTPIDAAGAATCGEHAVFRVGTLVVRLAERAVDHRARTTFRPWVSWEDGSIAFDGRWCEPLTPARARELGEKLVVAKRSLRDAAVAGGPAVGGPR